MRRREEGDVDLSRGETTTGSLSDRVARGVIGGLVAGALFLVVTMWFVTTVDLPAKAPLLLISTIVKGSGALQSGAASPGIGLIVHAVLSIVFGVVFALATPRLRTNGALALAGTLYGGLLYVVNFQILARVAFTAFKMANQPFELLVHIIFGTLLSFAFYSSGQRRGEPILALKDVQHARMPPA